ncbi:hypothetical protein YC2023_019567 [Brassica napus]
MLALPVDCSGDFGPRGLSVQYTQDICGCPSAHTGRPWLSVSTHWTSVDCPSIHISARWPFTWTVCDFGPRGLSVQYTHDVRVCPSAHTGRPCVSVSTHRTSVCVRQHTQDVCVCPSAHTGRLWLSVSTQRTFVAVHQLSVQYTQDVRGCPSAHTGRPWLSVSTHRASVDCPSVHISARLALPDIVAVRQHTQDVRGLSISTLIRTLALPVYYSGDFGQRGLSVQYTQDVRGCPSSHTQDVRGCPLAHRTSVDCPSVHISARRPFPWTVRDVRDCPSAHTVRPWTVHQYTYQHASPSRGLFGTHKMFVPVRQHTQDNRGLPMSTHMSTLVLGLSMLALPVDCSGDFGPHGLFVQYTQDVRGCPPAHTGRPSLPVGVRQHTHDVCGCLSAHPGHPWTVNQYTYQHAGPWAQHAGPWAQHAGPWAQHAGPWTQHAGPWTQHAGPWTQHADPWTQHAGPSRGLVG